MNKKTLLIKLSGELFSPDNADTIKSVISQIKELSTQYSLGIVIGGGNFFRGNQHGKQLGITEQVGHEVGMLATVMNGHILRDMLSKKGIAVTLLSAFQVPSISKMVSSCTVSNALSKDNACVIFAGGTGNPFVTTDTNAVIRALQIGAHEIWKVTMTVAGLFDSDPKKNPDAHLLKKASFTEVLNKKLGVMDQTAFAMAFEHNIKIRIFNLLEDNALLKAHSDKNFGSTIT